MSAMYENGMAMNGFWKRAAGLAVVSTYWGFMGTAAGAGGAGSVECLIEPTQTVEVATSTSGLLAKTFVARGDRVKKGQVLAELDSRAENAEYSASQFRATQKGPAELAARKIQFAKQKYERRQQMASEKLIAAQDSDDAESEFRLAQAELKVAEENRELARLETQMHATRLSLRLIRSPLDGVVVEQFARAGEYLEVGGGRQGVFRLAQVNPLKVHVILPKDRFGKLKVGDAVGIDAEVPVAKRLTAKVKSVDRVIDAASGTFVVILELPNPDLSLPAGIRCRAIFE